MTAHLSSVEAGLTVVKHFTGADAQILRAQAAAHQLSVDEYVRRATVEHLMSTWDRPVARLAS